VNCDREYQTGGVGAWREPCRHAATLRTPAGRIRPFRALHAWGGTALAVSTVLAIVAARDVLHAQEATDAGDAMAESRIDAAIEGASHKPRPDVSEIPVGKRQHPGYEPIGWRFGSVMFYPELITGVGFDSNVYQQSTDPQSDIVGVFSPRGTFVYERPDFDWTADFGADLRRYRELSGENTEDAHAKLKLRRDLTNALEFRAGLGAARKHEMRGESDAPTNAAEPPVYKLFNADAAFTQTFNRFGIRAGGDVRSYTYDDITTFSGDIQDQSFRDGTIVTGSLLPFYQLDGRNRLFARLALSERDNEGTGDLNRDSQGVLARAGVDFELTPLVFVTSEIGMQQLAFDNPDIDTVDALSFATQATWLMTPLMTASLSANRSISERVSQNYDARIDTSIKGALDYELLRNVLVSAGAKYTREDFIGIAREDDVVALSLGTKYLVNRWLALGLKGVYENRDSSSPANDFDQYVVWLNVTTQY